MTLVGTLGGLQAQVVAVCGRHLCPYARSLQVLCTRGHCGALVRGVSLNIYQLVENATHHPLPGLRALSLGGAPAAKTPSSMAHMSLSNLQRSPKAMWDMASPHIMSWGLVDLLQRQYHNSAMVSTSYAMTCNPSTSSVLMWVYTYTISSSKKRNIFGRWPKQKRLTSSKFTTLRLGALKLGQPHTTSLQWSEKHIFSGVLSLCRRMARMRKDIKILSWVLFF